MGEISGPTNAERSEAKRGEAKHWGGPLGGRILDLFAAQGPPLAGSPRMPTTGTVHIPKPSAPTLENLP